MKQLIVSVLLMGMVSLAFAKDSTAVRKNGIGISVGYMKLSLLDQLNSPLIYRSNLKTLNLFYVRNGEKSILRSGLLVGRGGFFPKDYPQRTLRNTTYDFNGVPLKDSVTIGGSMTFAKLYLQYLSLIAEGNNKKFYLGGGISEQLFYPDNFVRTGLINSISLSVAGTLQYSTGKRGLLGINVNLPLLAYNTRFPYHSTLAHPDQSNVKMLFSQGSKVVFVNKFKQVDLGADYAFALSKRWNLDLKYQFSWLNYQEPKSVKLLYNQFQAGLTFKF